MTFFVEVKENGEWVEDSSFEYDGGSNAHDAAFERAFELNREGYDKDEIRLYNDHKPTLNELEGTRIT